MKKMLLTALVIAAGNAAVRLTAMLRHPEYSAPLWLPVLVAFAGGFIGAFAVLAVIRIVRGKIK